MLINQPCAFIDIETTGSSASAEAITEIGLRLIDTTGEVVSWQQLLNPGRSIPGFIQQLTGITNAMVADQPFFEDIAPTLLEFLDSAVFVAHNARFDYSFIKTALERCGYSFKPKVLCTVKLSRSLYPEYRRHNLDTICERIGYQRDTSHRALADVDAMLAFVHKAISEHGLEAVNQAARGQLQRPSQPAHIPSEIIDSLPETPGVYRFYDDNGSLLYVGKSVRLRERVKSHFSADLSNSKEMKLSQEVRTIEITETAGELGALLLENQQIKTLQPIYNRRQRRYKKLWSFTLNSSPADSAYPGALQPVLGTEVEDGKAKRYGLYTTKAAAEKWYRGVISEHGLCKKVLGLEKTRSSCFNYQIKRCAGACLGEQSIDEHNQRLLSAFANNKLLAWPFDGPAVIVEQSDPFDSSSEPVLAFHVLDQWAHLGSVDSADGIAELLSSPAEQAFDRETYRLLNRYIHLAKPVDEFLSSAAEPELLQ